MRDHGQRGGQREVDMAGDDVEQALVAALVGHVVHFHFRHVAQQFRGEVL
jgi:hypothetical protein